MALSQVDICNLALSRAGGHTILQITSLGEASMEARQCAIKFPNVLRSALRSYAWNFATKTLALAMLANTNPLQGNVREKLYYYQYPEECLQILSINSHEQLKANTGENHPSSYAYGVELASDFTKQIVSSCPNAIMRYICYVDDPSVWDSLFCDAFAWKLGAELCMSLGGDMGKVEALLTMAEKAFDRAKSQDSKESQHIIVHSGYLGARI